MIGIAVIFLVVMMGVTMAYGAWNAASYSERKFFLKALFKGAAFAFIAFVILFVIVNLF